MKNKWTMETALKATSGKVTGKTIVVEGRVRGLKECGALDFLKNHCGYTVIFKEVSTEA